MPLNDPKLKKFMEDFHREHLPTINKHVNSAMKNPMKADHITHNDLHEVALNSLYYTIANYDHGKAKALASEGDSDHAFTRMLNSQLKYAMMNAIKPKTNISVAHYKKAKKIASDKRKEQSSEVKQIDPASLKDDS